MVSHISDAKGDLNKLKTKGLYRERIALSSAQASSITLRDQNLLNFCSNDYLGLANNPRLKKAFIDAANRYGIGSGASPLVCGRSTLHAQLESDLAEFTGRDKALVFSSGYLANLAIVSTFSSRTDTCVVQDRLNHASMIDGALLSRSRLRRYPHRDEKALERILIEEASKQTLVLTDSIFSMDGDMAPLTTISALCGEHDALLVTDDAHGFGIYGDGGRGTLSLLDLDQSAAPLMMATLGKALGCAGAFVAGSASLIELLIQKARPYIYSTALAPALAGAALESLKIVAEGEASRKHLHALIVYFKEAATSVGLNINRSDSPIQPLLLGCPETALKVSNLLLDKGFLVTAIRPPTVPQNTSRLRITLSAGHSFKDIDKLIDALTIIARNFPEMTQP
ncbi:MAG: 8-amino-7-oxononanoate synthase [Gammaproteobacteria bacterium]|nr:8-amino-7-oxononanoate synthase [Gammaproteobacteria bacterium]